MIPVFQTRMSRETCGNCFEACVASLLEVPLSAVPDFGAMVLDRRPDWPEVVRAADASGAPLPWPDGIDWDSEFVAWLAGLGVSFAEYDVPEEKRRDEILAVVGDGHWVASTQVHPKFRHSTVWRGGELVHNPTPGYPVGADGARVLGELRLASLFWSTDVARTARTLAPLLSTSPDATGFGHGAAVSC